jgi:hypothetical protein
MLRLLAVRRSAQENQMKLARSLSLVIAMVTAGTGMVYAAPEPKPAAPAPAPKADSTPAPGDVAKFLKFFDTLVDTVVGDKDTCPKMATDINALIDDNKEMLAMAKQAKAAGKTLPQDAQDHMKASVKRMLPAMQTCGRDPKVQAAFQRFDSK